MKANCEMKCNNSLVKEDFVEAGCVSCSVSESSRSVLWLENTVLNRHGIEIELVG